MATRQHARSAGAQGGRSQRPRSCNPAAAPRDQNFRSEATFVGVLQDTSRSAAPIPSGFLLPNIGQQDQAC
eukprot:4973252-Amphidinium_carterae.1